ncbi:DNA-directed RNA polymerase III [Theileria orientalis strain Shintoku]|uniref:DNA-directed RNA polymerase III n=1 Tax=Theileria orientalis strain Shintoku TaxID=869250 RepID=J4C7J3_THEOR|nr:DNA-directed RNA polymerase III [Theileria orientalis strain Shintoku]BAM39138.1 DNA-directed RNA polymerase III [Theileria orientalis strain Shintoku]|eukprot:XP_009689439.1 DNA-directed RNA polymerase III [Theileria orientalis strain Shintoku]
MNWPLETKISLQRTCFLKIYRDSGTYYNLLLHMEFLTLMEVGVLRDSYLVEKLKLLQDFEYSVFCTIETAGNKGIWTADIRKITGLLIHQVQRAVKNLCEVARLIKPLTDIHHKNRKLFILSTLEPSIDITGGSFYLNGEFNELLVEKLQEQIGLFLSKNIGATIDQILSYLKSSKLIQGELVEKDVYSVIKLLILENKVYTSVKNEQKIFIWCGNNYIKFSEEAFEVPCFSCNLIDSCNFGLVHKICPSKCKYMTAWLS